MLLPRRAVMPPELLRLAEAQRGALLGGQIVALLGRKSLARLTADGVVTRLWPNVYALPGCAARVTTRLRAAELTLGRPVTACLHTAADLHGFDLSGDPRTHVLANHDWSSEMASLVQHRCTPIRPFALVAGRRVGDLAETAVRVASLEKDPAKVMAVLDRVLHKTAVAQDALVAAAAELRIRGIVLVRELLPMADGRAESPGESWLRWVCIEAGFPVPTPQVRVKIDGDVSYRVDLGWPERRVGCEYEGVEFHTGQALTKDRTRYNALWRHGWLMQGVTSPMIWQTRRTLVAEIGSMLGERPG